MKALTRGELRNLIRILYGESVTKFYSIAEREALGHKLAALKDKAPRGRISG